MISRVSSPPLAFWEHLLRGSPAAAVCLAILSFSAGCTPALDWREVRPGPLPLKALLPCKPDAGDRVVTLDDRQVSMHLLGCKASGAIYVIGWVAVDSPSLLGATLGAWQDSTLAHIGIVPGPDAPAGTAFVPRGALTLPQSRRIDADGHASATAAGSAADPATSATPLHLRAAWFAWTGRVGEPAYAVQAAIYADRVPKPEAVSTFFEALRLSPP